MKSIVLIVAMLTITPALAQNRSTSELTQGVVAGIQAQPSVESTRRPAPNLPERSRMADYGSELTIGVGNGVKMIPSVEPSVAAPHYPGGPPTDQQCAFADSGCHR